MSRRPYFGGPQPTNAEFVTSREQQAMPDDRDRSGLLAGSKEDAVRNAAIGTPPTIYDVRCVYDSRPVSGYDFNFSASSVESAPGDPFVFQFLVPVGFRAVPRQWIITFDPAPVVLQTDIVFFPQNSGADVPNNTYFIGEGTTTPINTFFLVEENSTFGARITDVGGLASGSTCILQIYGNLLPVTGVALPFEVTNRKI